MTEINQSQIRELQREAAAAGDLDMMALCRLACGDDETATQSAQTAAWTRCAEVIADAAAQVQS
jgi:hypothetical protein